MPCAHRKVDNPRQAKIESQDAQSRSNRHLLHCATSASAYAFTNASGTADGHGDDR